MVKNRETRRRRLDFEPVIINKRVFLDLLSRELPDDYNVVLHEFHLAILISPARAVT